MVETNTDTDADTTQTLVTQAMRDAQGVWSEGQVSYPVGESDIRRWAIAVYWPETPPKIFWDADYAKSTRWKGIIAPQDFNPFAWPVERSGPLSQGPQPGAAPRKGENILNGGQTDTYFTPIRPGDVITSRTRLSHWKERTGRHGLTLYKFLETEWHNQDGELVKRRMSTIVNY
jgi:hypothetical protein